MTIGRARVRRAGEVVRTLVVAAAVMLTVAAATARDPASGEPVAFTITGSVQHLYPGSSVAMRVRIVNEEPFAIVVTSISATATRASHACPASYLSAGNFAGAVTVAGHGNAGVTMPVGMTRSAPDDCQGALFPLTFTGTAHKA